MSRTRWLEWRLLVLAVGAVVMQGVVPGWRPVQAQVDPLPAWERTEITDSVLELWTPASGALLTRTSQELLRSNDGGDSWTPVGLPPGRDSSRYAIEVDPLDHTRLFADGAEGLYRTVDDAATWTLVFPSVERVWHVEISPADPSLVYAEIIVAEASSTSPSAQPVTRLIRSRDGGDTWEPLPEAGRAGACAFSIPRPDPSDPARVLGLGRGCIAESADRGLTWTTLWEPAYLHALVGGRDGRWYALDWVRTPSRGRSAPDYFLATAYRSDDGARTWQEIGEWGMETDRAIGIAADPNAPDRVIVAVTGNNHQTVQSDDGGATWTPIGRFTYVPAVVGVASGIDGKNLYLAAKGGLYRLRRA